MFTEIIVGDMDKSIETQWVGEKKKIRPNFYKRAPNFTVDHFPLFFLHFSLFLVLYSFQNV